MGNRFRYLAGWLLGPICAALLLYAAAVIGTRPPLVAVLAGGAIGVAGLWWSQHRRPRTEPPAAADRTPVWTDYDDRAAIWDERVGSVGGALPASQLLGITAEASGWSASIVFLKDKATT